MQPIMFSAFLTLLHTAIMEHEKLIISKEYDILPFIGSVSVVGQKKIGEVIDLHLE
jgi:hypothetical protein